MAEKLIYKNYIIELSPFSTRRHRFIFHHKDYDGPDDDRQGFGVTVEDCQAAIDEMEEDNG